MIVLQVKGEQALSEKPEVQQTIKLAYNAKMRTKILPLFIIGRLCNYWHSYEAETLPEHTFVLNKEFENARSGHI